MVEERSPKGRLKELIGDRVLRVARKMQVGVDRKIMRLVKTHGQADRVATGHVAILQTTVQLILLLVIPVDQVFGAPARQPAALRDTMRGKDARWRTCGVSGADVVLDVERPVREVTVEGGTGRRIGTGHGLRRRRQVDVVLLQAGIGRAALVHLKRVGRTRVAQAVNPLPASIEVVEAVIFLVDDNDMRSEEHTSELQSHSDLVCRLLLEKKKKKNK